MSGNPALNTLLRNTLYDLKLRYGDKITVYRLDSADTDLKTGVKTATKTAHDIYGAIILPASEARRFFASISFISGAKAFISPGQQGWDQGMRPFIICGEDLRDFEFQPEDWIVYRDKRYEVANIEILEYDSGWMIIGKETKGQVPEQIINMNVVSTLDVEQEAVDS